MTSDETLMSGATSTARGGISRSTTVQESMTMSNIDTAGMATRFATSETGANTWNVETTSAAVAMDAPVVEHTDDTRPGTT